jgi:hypothetical protein
MGRIIVEKSQIDIESFPLEIKKWGKDTMLVTGPAIRATGERAFRFVPALEITGISKGYLYYTQICTWHKLIVTPNLGHDRQLEVENRKDEGYRRHGNGHYSVYAIVDNEVYSVNEDSANEFYWEDLKAKSLPVFSDAPCIELCMSWKKLWYGIRFETYLQYSEGTSFGTDLKSILKFDWALHGIVERDNDIWRFQEHPTHSLAESVRDRVDIFDPRPGVYIASYTDIKDEFTRFQKDLPGCYGV